MNTLPNRRKRDKSRTALRGLGCLCLALGGLLAASPAEAAEVPVGDKAGSFLGIDVEDITRTEQGTLRVRLGLNTARVDLKSQFEQVFTPYVYNEGDTVRLASFSLTGRKRLLSNERNRRPMPLTFYREGMIAATEPEPGLEAVPASGRGEYTLLLDTPWQPWMEEATFGIESEVHGCANCLKDIEGVGDLTPMAQTDFVQRSFFPEYLYVTPVAEAVKMREISARAYIDFVVNRTEINPTYRRNPEELAKIRATIDSVKNDKDISITSLHISGTASPEGSYENNVRLASGRTASLKEYVQTLYRFPQGLITTSYEPVDWAGLSAFLGQVLGLNDEGLRRDSIRQDQFQANQGYVANAENYDSPIPLDPYVSYRSELPHAAEILGIVNGDMEPYARNSKIRSTYPKEYAWLLANVYPALRHSDYRIEFQIKNFTEPAEIIEVMQTQPQKLSLEELFVAANSQEPGSELYNEAFQLAVAMYPSDETANLNAATAAMVRGDLISAQRYLSKAGATPEADYAWAMLTLLQGNTDSAMNMFDNLTRSLNPEVAAKAAAAKEGLDAVAKANSKHFRLIE